MPYFNQPNAWLFKKKYLIEGENHSQCDHGGEERGMQNSKQHNSNLFNQFYLSIYPPDVISQPT